MCRIELKKERLDNLSSSFQGFALQDGGMENDSEGIDNMPIQIRRFSWSKISLHNVWMILIYAGEDR